MSDPATIRAHVESLKSPDLHEYLKLAMRNGDNTRAAIADMELRRRRETA